MDKDKIIVIMGPTGCGKTTLGKKLSEKIGYIFLEEEWKDNPFLNDFYHGKNKLFETQCWFIERDIQRMKKAIELNERGNGVIVDKYYIENITFMNLIELEKRCKNDCMKIVMRNYNKLKKPDLVIDFKITVDQILNRIKLRNRDFENTIDHDWISSFIQHHSKLMQSFDLNIFNYNDEAFDIINNETDIETIKKNITKYLFIDPIIQTTNIVKEMR